MNLGQIKTGVQRFGFDSTDPIVDWVNEAYVEFWDAFDWPWKKTELAGVMTVGQDTVTTTLVNSEVPYNMSFSPDGGVSWVPIDYVPYVEYIKLPIYTRTGYPCSWTRLGNEIRVDPQPDYAYPFTLYHDLNLTSLSSDTDIPLIPTRYHFTLVRGGAAIGLEAENQEDRAQVQWDKFEDRIEKLKSSFKEQKGSFGRIRNVR